VNLSLKANLNAKMKTRMTLNMAVWLALMPSLAFGADDRVGVSGSPLYVPEAIEVDLSQDGLNLVVAELRKTFLEGELTGPMPDFDDRQYGVDIEVREMTYRVKVNDLSLRAGAEGLKLSVSIGHAIGHAGKIIFKKKVITTLRSTCKDTAVKIGGDGDILMEVLLDARVSADGHLLLQERHVSLPVPSDQYDVDGPRTCSGDLGIGSLIKYAVAGILGQARKRVEGALSEAVHDAVPSVAQTLDTQLHTTLPFEWSVLPTLPIRRLLATTQPTSVHVEADRLRLILGAEVKEVGRERFLAVQETMRAEHFAMAVAGDLTRFGTVGLNPALANELFVALTPPQPEFFELDPSAIPQIGEVLNRGTLATIWPDLNVIDLGEERVRAFVTLPHAPRIDFHRTRDVVSLKLRIEDFHLTFMVHREGAWQRYAHLFVSADAPVQIGLENRILKVGAGMAEVEVDGAFDSGYQPQVPIFERDMALVVARTLFDVLSEQGMITVIEIPAFPVGGEFVTLGGFRVAEPFLQLDIVRAE